MRRKSRADVRAWVGVGESVTFRAEVMPGRHTAERTFTVARVVASGRIELTGLAGEHAETEFESEKTPVALANYQGRVQDAKAARSNSRKNEA